MLAPINANKHYVHLTNASVASGAIRNHFVVDAVVAPASANAFDVEEGSVVKAIYFEYWINSDGGTGTTTQFALIIEKVPSNLASVSAAQMLNLGAYTNKKNIFYSTQGNLGASVDGQSSVPIQRGWLLIPKGKQRMGLGDRIITTIAPVGQAVTICGIVTYKEYR